MKKVLFVKYNTLRRPRYQISTTIIEENGERYVEKAPTTKEAQEHVLQMQANYALLSKAHDQVLVAAPTIVDGCARYEYIEGKTFEEALQNHFDDLEGLYEKIKEALNLIYSYNEEYKMPFSMTDEFREVFGEQDITGKEAVNAANVDLVFDNIIQKDGKWLLLDYEWVLQFPVPIDFLKYRTAVYFYDRHNLYFSGKFTRAYYLERLGYSEKDSQIYDDMEVRFQEFVRGVNQEYHCLKLYEKNIIPFRDYASYAHELEDRDASISQLNAIIASNQEYIKSMEDLIQKYHNNPAYRVMNGVRKIIRRKK